MNKTCTKCSTEKPITDFYKRKDSVDGYRHICKQCSKTTMQAYHAKNKDSINKKQRETYAANPDIRKRKKELQKTEAYKQKRKAKRDSLTESQKAAKRKADRMYSKLHPDKKSARRAKRRAAELQRTVPWANLALIAKFYTLAKELTEQTGILHHVDHIIPLQGKNVSGFHVETNLQVIPAIDNLKKSNSCEYGESGLCPAGDYI